MIPETLEASLRAFDARHRRILVLTGAGVSAESGIPTFRGADGFWRIGSAEYQPQEIATMEMFRRHPEAVWQWYLYRLALCRRAAPNAGHRALAEMEARFSDRFTLVTQNVDGLHQAAGSTTARTLEIHGNIAYVRCARECRQAFWPLPDGVRPKGRDEDLSEREKQLLRCPHCGGWTRPHVLWFDEIYNEHYYHAESALDAADRAALLLVAGTSGATNLPNRIVYQVARRGGTVIEINVAASAFSRVAASTPDGGVILGPSADVLPVIATWLSADG